MLSRFGRLAALIGHARTRALLVACGLIVGIGLAAAVGWITVDLRSDHLNHARRDLGNLALVLAEQVDRELQGIDLLQLGLIDHMRQQGIASADAFSREMSSFAIQQDLAHRIEGLSYVGALSLHDAEGRLINFSRFWPPPDLEERERDFIATLLESHPPQTFISAPSRSLTTGKWTIYLSRRFESPDGQLIGILASTIFTDYFEQFYARIEVDADGDGISDGSFALYRNDGMLLARFPHADPRIGTIFSRTENYNRILGAEHGIARLTSVFDGKDRLVVAHRVPHYPLLLAVSDTVEAVLSEWRREVVGFYSVTAILELVLAATILLGVRHLRSYELLEAAEMARARAEERERGAHALELQGVRFDSALNNMLQGLMMFDQQSRLLVVNRRFFSMFGVPDGALAPGMGYGEVTDAVVAAGQVTAEDMQGVRERRAKLMERNERATATWEISCGRAFKMSFQPMDEGWLTTYEEITDRRAAEAKIEHLAHHDSLTDLPNRVLFRRRLDDALAFARRGQTLALFCLDLDQFKAINDTLGHPVGDALLKAVAQRLSDRMRETDIIARLGGDEFAIVYAAVAKPNEATGFADRLLELLSAPFETDGYQIVISASIGIAFAPQDGLDPDELLRCADLAMYRAKVDGRGIYRLFHAEMDAQMQARRRLELDLREAVEREQLAIFYQPMISVQEQVVAGFEALLRWHHPTRGAVPPSEFIPLAEEIGLILPIGDWVLRQACTDAAAWPGNLKVAVNLSSVQFRSHNLVDAVAAALDGSRLAPARLELEITETVMLEETEATLATLRELHALGARISMDDFGTGYSSLSYLRRFPFDRIKIDQSFVRELNTRQDCGAIVRAVTSLGRELGIATTAEGVETWEQLDQLCASGCTEVQGYLFSPAVPVAEVTGLLSRISAMFTAAREPALAEA
jgi:diguanylate cyclase (GGDEF)-like protein